MTAGPEIDLVHAPLARWAQSRGDAAALRCGESTHSFAELQRQITQRADNLRQARAPATVLVNADLPLSERLIDFLGIVASGRCAVVGDPDWPLAVRQTVHAAIPAQPQDMPAPQPTTPFYVGYTSGSTGTPKGYRRHHRSWTESFKACLDAFGPEAAGCILAPGRDAQSLFLFGMLLGLWTGGGVVVQEQFSATAALDILRAGHTPCLVAVPSQLLMMLDTAKRQDTQPIASLHLILVSGSRWMRSRTAELRALFPMARIVEFYGASETSFIAWMETDEQAPAATVGHPFRDVELQIRAPLEGEPAGLIYVRSPMVFMDYMGGGNDSTAALRDGDWICVRDLGYLDAQGRLCLAGRQNRMIVTLGKNLFPEEVEAVLERHPAIACASVHGHSDVVRGQEVVALIGWKAGWSGALPDALALKNWCRQHVEGYKIPRKFLLCDPWCYTTNSKTDHSRLALLLSAQQGHSHLSEAPCLSPLR